MAIPAEGTHEYRWWQEGALAEAAARKEGLSAAGIEILSTLDALARSRPQLGRGVLAACLIRIYSCELSLRKRLALAWYLIH